MKLKYRQVFNLIDISDVILLVKIEDEALICYDNDIK